MQDSEKKYFADPQTGKGNFDAADFALGVNEWTNMENCRTRTTDAGVTMVVEGIGSTTLLSVIEPSVTFAYNGGALDIPGNRFLYFQYNTTGPWHRIMCYSFTDKTTYIVALSSQITGGLNFSKDYFIHSSRVINGLLYWTEFLNDQRRIDIDAGIKLNQPSFNTSVDPYTSPIAQSVIRLIRNPPAFPIIPQKAADLGATTNFIGGEAFIFSYLYIYRNFEESVGSPWSRLINYNSPSESWNYVSLTIPFSEYIEQDVLRIHLVAYYLNGGVAYIIKTWDKDIASEAQEIVDHDAGITQLNYNFYNNILGTSLGTADGPFMTKIFDSVPVRSRTLEIAKDRLHLAYNLKGYTTPNTTSLQIEVVDSGTSGVTKVGYDTQLTYREIVPGPAGMSYTRVWLVYLVEVSPQGYYAVTSTQQISTSSMPSALALPDPITTANLAFRGATQTDVIVYYETLLPPNYGLQSSIFAQPGDDTTITDISVGSFIPFKTDSSYQAGIVFYDFAQRKCGYLTLDSLVAEIPDRDYNLSSVASLINWTLSNANALSEIPDWSYYFQIVITKNLDTRFFLQAVTDEILYARRDADGNYDIQASYTSIVPASVALAISLDFLVSYGFGYSVEAGDIIKIYKETPFTIYTLAIKSTSGKYLIAQIQDIGTTTSTNYIYEIRRPYIATTNEPMYENGQVFAIDNPGTISRRYGTLTGTINGDIYIKTRTHNAVVYYAEAMSPSDAQYQNWNTDASRPNFTDKIGQRLKGSSDVWSNTIIEGSEQNGLSSFEALNEKLIPQENGPIQKLQLTSKVQDEIGVVMLAICEKETASLYLGETQQYGSSASTTLTLATDVIGTINILKGSFGTRNPESVFEFRGNVFWIDIDNGKVIQYSTNGLFPISNYDCTRFWKLFCEQYKSMTPAQIEALGSRPLIFTTVDPHHWELLISIPKLLAVPPKGYLPDYPSTIYPFDIYDGQAKTVVYKLNAEPNYWQGSYAFAAEGFLSMNNQVYSFKFGQLYQHNSQTSFCQFYGTQYKARIMPAFNKNFNIPKTPDNIKIECNLKPTLTYLFTDSPHQQSTDLLDFDYKDLEGLFYAAIYRNKLIPTSSGFVTTGLLTGQKMRSTVFKMLLEFAVTNENVALRFVTLSYQLSSGHKQ